MSAKKKLDQIRSRYTQHALATEEFSSTAVVNAIGQTLNYVKQSMTALASRVQLDNHPQSKHDVQEWNQTQIHNFVMSINKTNYLTYCEMNIAYSPEGMIATYLQYYSALYAALEHISTSEKENLIPYVNFLGGLVSLSHDTLKTTKSAHVEYKALESVHERLEKGLAACFKDGSDVVNRKINEVIGRNADWAEVFKVLKACEEITSRLNIKNIKKLVDDANTYLIAIEENIKTEPDMLKANKEVISHLSEGAYHVAHEVELISTLIYQEQVIRNAVYRTAQNVQTQLITTK